ncbi:hypothetical protein PISMIDRAFT_114569, partial [Pisolithus microcarpus 441]
NAEDIVAAHQQCNHAARLPNNSQLNAIQEWQSSTLYQVPQAQSMTSLPSGMSQLLGAVNPPVPPVGPAIVKAEPWQIHFYKPVVQDILKHVKQFSHCDVASINAFLLCPHFNTKAVEYMEEAISKRLSCGLSVSNGWWPHYMNDISKLLWEDLSNWHLSLRKKAHMYMTQCYNWDPQNHHKVNSGIAKDLGDHGVFLRDGVDEYGHMNNFAHPALTSLIIDFFYTGSSSLSQLFPEVFRAEVLRVTVAIPATAVMFT